MNKGQEYKGIQALERFNEYKDFIKDKQVEFVIKKTERVVSVVYMICEFVPHTEVLHMDLKKTSHATLRCVSSFPQLEGLSVSMIDTAHSNLQYLSSLLSLAYISGFVSESNIEILKGEINYLHKHIEDLALKSATDRGQIQIKSNLFTVNHSSAQPKNKPESKNSVIIKDTPNTKNQKPKGMSFKKDSPSSRTAQNTKTEVSKEDRDEKVISVIRDKGVVSIKDISSVIFDVSEKTIQRTLQNLIDKGQIKKEGERRWAKYSIK